jgi:membrane fusion protein (multidrug efflux system)
MKRTRRSTFYNLTLASLLASSMLVSCKNHEESEEAAEPEKETAVNVVVAERGLLSTTFKVPGELIPFQEVDLYAKENSFVKKVLVDVGSEVKQGQLLASLEAPEISSRLSEASSRLQSQEAIYSAARARYDRLLETSKTPGTISPNDLEQAIAQRNSQQAQLQASKSAYRQIVETQNYLQIRAPFAGIISAKNASPGAYVGPSGKGSDLPMFVLQTQQKLRLVVSVPEAYAGLLRQGEEVEFNIKAMPQQTFKAKISRLAGTLDARLRSERVEIDVLNKDKKLLPGMYAEVVVPLPANDSTFIVPKTAVVTSTEKIFVVKVVEEKAVWVDVKKGRESNGRVEVYGDLRSGDRLVQSASEEVRNGSVIKNVKLVTE